MSDLIKRMKATIGMGVIARGSSAHEYEIARSQFVEAALLIAELEAQLQAVRGVKTYNALEVVGETLERGKADMWVNVDDIKAAIGEGDE